MTGRDKQLEDYLTVGGLKKRLEGLPDDAPVFIQRIQDEYFELGKGWTENAVLKPIEGTEYNDIYVQAWCAFQYEDDDSLYLTPHY